MMILLVRELTRDLPPLTEIELHGNRIGTNDAKAARLVATGSDLSFTLREQFARANRDEAFSPEGRSCFYPAAEMEYLRKSGLELRN
jgi:hypothetical protein